MVIKSECRLKWIPFVNMILLLCHSVEVKAFCMSSYTVFNFFFFLLAPFFNFVFYMIL